MWSCLVSSCLPWRWKGRGGRGDRRPWRMRSDRCRTGVGVCRAEAGSGAGEPGTAAAARCAVKGRRRRMGRRGGVLVQVQADVPECRLFFAWRSCTKAQEPLMPIGRGEDYSIGLALARRLGRCCGAACGHAFKRAGNGAGMLRCESARRAASKKDARASGGAPAWLAASPRVRVHRCKCGGMSGWCAARTPAWSTPGSSLRAGVIAARRGRRRARGTVRRVE